MNVPIELELALLRIVRRLGAPSWHQIASHLSNVRVPRVPDMMDALKRMAAAGLLERETTSGTSADSWTLTADGVAEFDFLESLSQGGTSPCWVDRFVAEVAELGPRALPERLEAA